jgi:nucleoside-diphosphate-sugar epimerase
MKVVVTGGAGLVGRNVSEHLATKGHDVLAIDRIAKPPGCAKSDIVDLANVRDLERAFRGADGVIHMARVPFPYASAGYDAATRTWRKPDLIEDVERFNLNTAMTSNVFGAALASGVKKMVLGSSLAVYGFYYPSRPAYPDYLPVDEEHPLRPDDPYGLTKLLGEKMADAAALKHAMDIVSLRFPVVFDGEEAKLLRQQTTAIRGYGAFWTYLHVDDAADGCRLALESNLAGHEVFNLCASTTLMKEPTIDLVRGLVPEISDFRRTDRSNWAGYDTAKARNVLGFEATRLVTL